MSGHTEQPPAIAVDPQAESDLCTACGICCDGSLFRFARVQPNEEERMRTLGLDLTLRRRGHAFTFPCTRFDGCCTIYPDRPRVCRNFACKLLKACRSGETSWEQARAIVATAVTLRAGSPVHDRTSTPEVLAEDTVEARQGKLKTVAYQRYVDRHFRLRQRPGVIEDLVPGDSQGS